MKTILTLSHDMNTTDELEIHILFGICVWHHLDLEVTLGDNHHLLSSKVRARNAQNKIKNPQLPIQSDIVVIG